MHRKVLILFSICAIFVFIWGTTGFAQTPEPPHPEHETRNTYGSARVASTEVSDLDAVMPGRHPQIVTSEKGISSSPEAVVLGEPGFSFKYEKTFGTNGEAYFDDATHLYDVQGLGTDGENVWIAEGYGRRALKYANDNVSTLLMQINQAGNRETGDTSINRLADVAVDISGNIWLVDAGADHVIKYNSSGAYQFELGEAWTDGSDNDHLNYPYGVAVDSHNYIYISDESNHRVQVFDNSGTYLTTIGNGPGSGNNQFHYPLHLTTDGNDRLYVADYNNQRVQVFDVSSAPTTIIRVGAISLTGQDGYPEGVAVDLANNRIYVADSNNDKVLVYNATSWAYITSVSLDTWPSDVAVDSSGKLYVSQPYPTVSQVWQYNSSLSLKRRYGTDGVPYLTNDTHYNRPSGVAVDSNDSVYLVERYGQRLIKLNSKGVPQWVVGEPGVRGDDNAHFRFPEDVDTGPDGRIYVADSSNCRIQIYNSDGSYSNTLDGNCDNGTGEFEYAEGVAVSPNGNIYVADSSNGRVLVYNSNLTYITSLSNTGSAGGNLLFDYIRDVEADASGNIYVLDNSKHVVYIFNSNLEYQFSLGEYGVSGYNFGHFRYPTAVTVDDYGRIYVSDVWGNRIQVFDSSGAFLTSIGSADYGSSTGQLFDSRGLAVDSKGALLVADSENHRIQKYTPSLAEWKQVNIDGFGYYYNKGVPALEVFNDHLYAGMNYWGNTGVQIWRMDNSGVWEEVVSDGFGDVYNIYIDDMVVFNNQLYASVYNWNWSTDTYSGAEIWRSSNGTNWDNVVSAGFGDATNIEILNFAVFNNTLYATTASNTSSHGAEIWSSDTGDDGDWSRVVSNGFGNPDNSSIISMIVYDGCLYAGPYNETNMGVQGAEVWRTCNTSNWDKVEANGFGDPYNLYVSTFGVYNNRLYAGTFNSSSIGSDNPGPELWSCQVCDGSDWQISSAPKGFGDLNNRGIYDLILLGDILYASVTNWSTGLEIWKTSDGVHWFQGNPDGFGDSLNVITNFNSNASAIFNGELYFGTYNSGNAGEIWKFTTRQVFLPVIIR